MAILAIANVGGHLRELVELLPRMNLDGQVIWVTNDGPQSRSLLVDAEVVHLPYARARSVRDAYRNAAIARRVLRSTEIDVAVTTGSSLAVSVLPIASRRGASLHYIESATRIDGPSLSGKLVRWLPRINLYSQSETWANDRWQFRGTVFDGFDVEFVGPCEPRKVVVTVGTSTFSGFRRLVVKLLDLLPPDGEVLWQTGSTDLTGLDIDGHESLLATELEDAMREAELVIAHAGAGSALTALACGRYPILVPRDPAHGEHVDAHQFEIADRLASAGLAEVARVEELTPETLKRAAGAHVHRVGDQVPFDLERDGRERR